MSVAEDHPSERELALSAHRRHKAFCDKIKARAVALNRPPSTPAVALNPPLSVPAVALNPPLSVPAVVVPLFHFEGPIRKIQNLLCEHLAVKRPELLSERRERRLVIARQIGMFLSKENTSATLPEIGRQFGDRDHSTVLHAVRRVRAIVDTAAGTGISTQWLAPECDVVRAHIAHLQALLSPEILP